MSTPIYTFADLKKSLIQHFGYEYASICENGIIDFDLSVHFETIIKSIDTGFNYPINIYNNIKIHKRLFPAFNQAFLNVLDNIKVYQDLVNVIRLYKAALPLSDTKARLSYIECYQTEMEELEGFYISQENLLNKNYQLQKRLSDLISESIFIQERIITNRYNQIQDHSLVENIQLLIKDTKEIRRRIKSNQALIRFYNEIKEIKPVSSLIAN